MDNVKVFENADFGTIRTLNKNGKLLFCGKDVAKALGYANYRKAILDHCKGVTKCDTLTQGGVQNMSFVTEGDLYRLIANSKLPTAQRFESWVFDEVLPSIRKTGGYGMTENQKMIAETRIHNIKIRKASLLNKIAEGYTGTYKQVLQAYATKELTGDFLLPLPELEKKTLSATDVGEILGISAHKVGKIANEHNLKTPKNGKYFHDKSKSSNKEVENFRYYENAVDEFKKHL